jgi:hypothetical protein
MGYYYGKARVTKNRLYDVLSLAVPILIHTLFDMFLISLMAIIGDGKALIGATEQELMALPYWNYVVPSLVCAIAVFIIVFVALILMFRKIGIWSENGEKGELLKQQN